MSEQLEPVDHSGIIAWFTKNSVAANLLMWLIVVSGLLVVPVVKKEVFPNMSARTVTVTVPYPGASPEEVEEGVCRRVEEAVQGLSGIRRITSSSNENGGIVSIEVLPGLDVGDVLSDVKTRVDAIDTFREETETPIVQEVVLRRQVINIAVSGDADERTLKKIGQRVRDDLTRLPQITQVDLSDARPYEVSIEVSEEAMRRYGLTFDEVASAVRRSSLDLPGGSIKTAGGEILLRSKGQAYHGRQFEDLVLLARPDGTRVLLGDVADVRDAFEDVDQSARFDGEPAVLVQVFRVGDQSVLDIADAVKTYIHDTEPTLPAGIHLTGWRDQTKILRSRMELLTRNALQGLLLVFIVLALFLRLRLAFWVSLGIPVSFLGAMALMPTWGVSVNMISLFAFIVVLGIVVDDAIVVGESVYKHLQRGYSGLDAAIKGSKEVAVPVVFGVLTTVAAFWPMLDVDSNARELWRHIPLVVIPCLLFSLAESKLILPAHLSHDRSPDDDSPPHGIQRLLAPVERAWGHIQRPVSHGLDWFVDRIYRPVLHLCLEWRYVAWSVGIATFALSIGLVATGWIRFTFFPVVEGDNVVAELTMPLGTPVEVTETALRRMEQAARDLQREVDGASKGQGSVFEHVLTSVGAQPYREQMAQNSGSFSSTPPGSHRGEINIQLAPSEEREVTSDEVLKRWRKAVGAVPGAVELTFTSSLMSTGKDIDVQLSSPDVDQLRQASAELRAKLATFNGVDDITDSLRNGKREVKLRIKPTAEPLGLTLADLARQVRQGFYGEEAQRVQRGQDEVKVMVRYPQHQRRSLGDLEQMRIRTPAGDEVPLSVVADVEQGHGYATIERTDLARTANVIASVDENTTTADEVLGSIQQSFLPDLLARHPGLRASFEGDTREQKRTLESLLRGSLVALFVIYALMAVPFRSYIQPLVVMVAIPFGLVGAIWGHVLMGMSLSIVSGLGLVALVGVVVNDSLVLVDFINRHHEQGNSYIDAVHRAGVVRFRPILLTSLTTFASLTPVLLERSVQAKFLMPMAVSLAFGIMFSTFITLVLVPSGYLILEDIRGALRRLFREPAEAEPGGDAETAQA